jgi:hypothetical protein
MEAVKAVISNGSSESKRKKLKQMEVVKAINEKRKQE